LANELLVSSTEEGLQLAILENRRLVELQYEKRNNLFAVGDVFLGKVKRVLPALNAVFVDIGYTKDSFLHYSDLGPQIETQTRYLKSVLSSNGRHIALDKLEAVPDIDKHGKISEVLKTGQVILVQIMKEAISSKGPRLASQLSLAGQYCILLPFGGGVSVSRKMHSGEEKKRVRKILETWKPRHMGVIARTASEGVEAEKLQADLNQLLARWNAMVEELVGAKPPRKVLSEINRTSSVLRDMLSIGFDSILTDSTSVYEDLMAYVNEQQPDLKRAVQLKKSREGLFEQYGVEKQIKGAFGKTVNLGSGAYLVVEHTEALHVIDVNSGSLRMPSLSPEENALRINLDAASEIARQLRLRDMGGIIVIDFIDMRSAESKKKVFEQLSDEMKKDRARHTILPMSRFGLIQVTRQRVRPEVNISTEEVCPSCGGTGKINPSILLADEVNRNVDFLFRKNKMKQLRMKMNPFLAAYFTKGFLSSPRFKWLKRYGKWVRIDAVTSMPFTQVRYFGEGDEEIKLD
jgi:ribonuclease G